MPSTSPIAQPVRQCSVALTAVVQELVMTPTIYPLGVYDQDVQRARRVTWRCLRAPLRCTGRRVSPAYPHLLEPITLGDLTLRNRVVMGSMHTGLEDRRGTCPS
jgi:hypothetical protein